MRRFIATLLLLLYAVVTGAGRAEAARQPAGTLLGSAVVVDYMVNGVTGTLTAISNIPFIKVLPIRTEAALTILRIGQNPGQETEIDIPAVDYALQPYDLATENFVSLDRSLTGLAAEVNRVSLIESRAFLPGEVMFFHLYDAGINHLPDVTESVTVRITGSSGDTELFRLTESGPDTGQFYGFAPTVDVSLARPGDGRIAVESNAIIEAVYRDAFDDSDTRTAVALFDPGVRIVDAFSGKPLDGAVLRVMDVATGGETAVYGLDGTSTVTQAIVSGQSLTDTSGRVYAATTGEARVPHLRAGRYRFDVDPPPGYVFPSDTGFDLIAAIDRKYRMGTGSRGDVFEVDPGGPPFVDIPLDPRGTLFLRKTVDRSEVAHGDFVAFSLRLTNDDDRIAQGVVVTDLLPQGFVLEPGSLRRDGEPAANPEISNDGTGLTFRINSLEPGRSVDIRYVVRIGPGVQPGLHETVARAQAPFGFRSNAARATLTVRDAFMKDESFVLGRVFIGSCDADGGKGVRARLLTETGIVITADQDGLFHLDGLRPGRHVLRLDESSLPEGVQPLPCPVDLRPGDSARARTLDLRGGLVRNIRFRLKDTRSQPEEKMSAPSGQPPENAANETPAPNADPKATSERVSPPKAETAPLQTEYEPGDLAGFEPVLQIVYPAEDRPPSRPLVDLGVAYPFGHKIDVTIDGEPVDSERFENIVANKEARIAMRRWRGIEVGDGPFEIAVSMRDASGAEVAKAVRRFGAKNADSKAETDIVSGTPPVQPLAQVDGAAGTPSRPATSPAPRIVSADDLASLPKELQIVYPGPGDALSGGSFDIGVAYPMPGKLEVSIDGAPVDPSLFDKTLANRKARMILRRWKGVPLANGGGIIEATLLDREGAVLARVTRNVGKRSNPRSRPGDEGASFAKIPSTDERDGKERVNAKPSGPTPVAISSTPEVLAIAKQAHGGTVQGTQDEVALLARLPKTLAIVYPEKDAVLADPSLRLGVAFPFGNTVEARVNGVEIRGLSAEKSLSNRKAGMALRRWRGVDLPDGESIIEIVMRDREGIEIARETRRVHYITDAVDAEFVPEQSVLIADGAAEPSIAIRLTDSAGRALHAGRRVPVIVAPPYRSVQSFERFEDNPLISSDASRAALVVGKDGLARLRLRPTTLSGEVDIRVRLGSGEVRLRPWLAARTGSWIVVGHAEGTIGHTRLRWGSSHDADDDGLDIDGQTAFYARGPVYDDWILTLAYDSERQRNDDDLFGRIDPNDYYPVYGDASTRNEIAPSRYPLFARVERGRFYAMFGDYETGLDRTELGAYNRALTGLKAEYRGERLSVNAFAAEADQQFLRREFQANRGVGPYTLDGPVIRNSETVILLTRERERLDTILTETALTPFVDYDIDYADGTVILRISPDPVDDAFNPRFLAVEFERDSTDPGRITAGGRAALTFFDDRLELGATAIHEEGGGHDAQGNLAAFDATVRLGDVELEAEVAGSHSREDGIERSGTAMRAEARYASEGWRGRIYVQQSDEDFGIANQSVGQQGRLVVGGEIRATVADPLYDPDEDEGQPAEYEISASLVHDEALATGARRTSAEALLSRKVDLDNYGTGTVSLGYRGEHDRPANGSVGTSHKLLGRADANILNGRATVSIERAQTLAKTGAGTSPDSTVARIEGRITPRVRAKAAVEVFDAGEPGSMNAAVGVDADLWEGGTLEAGVTGVPGLGSRLGATLGVQQDLKLTERLSMTLRAHRTQELAGSSSPVAKTLFASTEPGDTTTASAGIGYGGDGWNASARFDAALSDGNDRYGLGGAIVGDVTEALTLAAASDFTLSNGTGKDEVDGSLTLAAAYRPLSARYSGLERMELRFSDGNSGTLSAIHNLTTSFDLTERISLAFAHGLRYSTAAIDGRDYSSLTNFVGADVFYNFNKRWFFGAHGSALTAIGEGETAYSYGASVGFAPREGILLTLGYNVEGFDDADFDDAHSTRQGPFLRISLRFDEDDIRSLIPKALLLSH